MSLVYSLFPGIFTRKVLIFDVLKNSLSVAPRYWPVLSLYHFSFFFFYEQVCVYTKSVASHDGKLKNLILNIK